MRCIGMDVHRTFAQIAIVEDGICRDEGRIGVTPEALREWAAELDLGDEVVLEATTNSDAIAMLLTPLVARVVVSNPRKTRAIAEAKVKTDKVDARILAQLSMCPSTTTTSTTTTSTTSTTSTTTTTTTAPSSVVRSGRRRRVRRQRRRSDGSARA